MCMIPPFASRSQPQKTLGEITYVFENKIEGNYVEVRATGWPGF